MDSYFRKKGWLLGQGKRAPCSAGTPSGGPRNDGRLPSNFGEQEDAFRARPASRAWCAWAAGGNLGGSYLLRVTVDWEPIESGRIRLFN